MFEIRAVMRGVIPKVFNIVENPAAVFDKSCGTLLKIGEYEAMKAYQLNSIKAYREAGLHDIMEDIVVMELPHDQEEIDKVFQISGYIKRLYDKTMKGVTNDIQEK